MEEKGKENNKEITLCTVHFNTPLLMDALVKSIEMHVPNYHLYIFDNSDKEPYHTNNKNITIIDNTKGQIIDFDKWLEKYPNRVNSCEITKTFASAKHCYTIQKCIDLIDKNFILLDSDILLKQDITPLFDERYIYVGQTIQQPSFEVYRIVPFLCFINVDECKRKKIPYFDENYMHGLNCCRITNKGDLYDTGGAFFLYTRNSKYKEINLNDYIVHYQRGSWAKNHDKFKNRITHEQWLEQNKQLWSCK